MNINPGTILEEWSCLKNSLIAYTGKYRYVYLFGAGKIGATVKGFLKFAGIVPKGYIVSKLNEDPHMIDGLPVLEIKDIEKIDCTGVILSLSTKKHAEVLKVLSDYNILDVFIPTARMYELMFIHGRIITDERAWGIRNYFAPKIHVNNISFDDMHSILLLALENIGDVIMFLPFARELKNNCNNDTRITAVVLPAVESFMRLCPYVDRVIVYDIRKNSGENIEDALMKSKEFATKYLQDECYDVAFLEGWYNLHIEHLFLMMYSNSKLRVGFSESNMPAKAILNKNFDKFLSVAIKSTEVMHEVTRNLLMLKALGGNIQSDEIEFWHTDEDDHIAEKLLISSGCKFGNRMVAIVPHANDKRRIWDKAYYLELLNKIKQDYSDLNFLILGNGEADRTGEYLVEELQSSDVINLAGRTSLGVVSAILKRCNLYIGSNTGLTHIAAAWKVPVVEIICNSMDGDPLEYSSPYRYHAWHTKNVSVRPARALPGCGATCYSDDAHCINQIKVDDVLKAVKGMEVL